eukprot:TRINITY_DN28958_c0_g1_i2.p1 TRINITY_DN28958_c0_g1~~TRINITY_DN28958_c0_g1_i2.p1  ORF type:complete len:568 (+),score=185.21 TRINITY_DN28958_c0_g1_i2:75-1706(+)
MATAFAPGELEDLLSTIGAGDAPPRAADRSASMDGYGARPSHGRLSRRTESIARTLEGGASGGSGRLSEPSGSAAAAGPSGREYLRDFYEDLLIQQQLAAEEVRRQTVLRQLDMRYRIFRLANADMFRVRFVEEARWELRERREVIERRENLERSSLRAELLDVFVEYLVVGGGEWSEDSARASILVSEARAWRRLLGLVHAHRLEDEDQIWTDYVMAEDRWRWDVELTVRQGLHQLQVREHRHRTHVTCELYPAALNRLLHVMELEWVELIRAQREQYVQLLGTSMEHVVSDEEWHRTQLKRRYKRVMREYALLARMLHVEHTEEFERELNIETANRVLGVLYSRETIQIKTLLERTRLLNDSVAQALAERSRMQDERLRAYRGEMWLAGLDSAAATAGAGRSGVLATTPAPATSADAQGHLAMPRLTGLEVAGMLLDPGAAASAGADAEERGPVSSAARTALSRLREDDRELEQRHAESRERDEAIQRRLETLVRGEADLGHREEAVRRHMDVGSMLSMGDMVPTSQISVSDLAAVADMLR